MERLLKILEEVKPGIDFKSQKKMITDGILESFDIVSLIALLNDEFNIEITATELIPENFETIDDIMNLINKLSM